MNYTFSDNIPGNLNLQPVIISGSESLLYRGQEYLLFEQKNEIKAIYEIRYQSTCSPFKQAISIDNILAVGNHIYFYLFNAILNENILQLEVEGYFGGLYLHNEHFYIADAHGIYCIDKLGKLLWQNNNLAIDGVIINNFTDNNIFGSGEWDPPGGWLDFILDKHTGITKK
jgi:hypothetical protein